MNNPKFESNWSFNRWIAIGAVAAFVWLFFSWYGPGSDFFVAYTDMVLKPERLPEVADYPWTLNPTWMVPFMAPFVTLPGKSGYIVFLAATILMVLAGVYVFGGKPIPVLLSSHMAWILWWGQLEGWGVLALVLAWFAHRKNSWPLMFLALTMAAFKPQIGFVPVLALWWWSGQGRWKSLAALIGLFIGSILVWGPWPVWYLEGIVKFIGDKHFGPWNASLGVIALPLFVPALLLPLDKKKRLIALTATTYVASSYMPYYSTILLFCFPLPGWAYLFGFLGYLPTVIGTFWAWNAIVLLPLSVLVWLYASYFKKWWRERTPKERKHRDPLAKTGAVDQ